MNGHQVNALIAAGNHHLQATRDRLLQAALTGNRRDRNRHLTHARRSLLEGYRALGWAHHAALTRTRLCARDYDCLQILSEGLVDADRRAANLEVKCA